MPPNPARLRTIDEAALVTGRSHWTIRTWARQERIPSIKRDGHLLVDLVAAAHLSEQTGRRNRSAQTT